MSAQLRGVLDRLKNVRPSGSGYVALCPAHDDKQPSLSVTLGESGNVLLNCHAGCEFDRVVGALGLESRDLAAGQERESRSRMTLSATYVYMNADGSVFARKERFTDETGAKTFRWSRPDPERPNVWIPGGNANAPLYRLPEVVQAPASSTIIIVEGEKDADRLADLGYIATTTPNGAASKWRDQDTGYFAGRRVCVIADDDEAGRNKAKNTADGLAGTAAAVGVITVPNPQGIKGFDVSDFLSSGGTVDELRALIERFDEPRLPAEVIDPAILEERVLALWAAGGSQPGIYPGWRTLAPFFRPKVGQLTIVTGSPNAGKSTWLDDLIIRTSCADDGATAEERCARWRWIVFSAEQFPVERHASLLLQKLFAKPFTIGPTARMSETEIRAGLRTIRDYVTLLNPSFSSLHIDRILEVAAELNAQSKRHALLLDPFNILSATSRRKGESEHDFINEFLSKLRTFAQAESMAVFVVAHPTKLQRDEAATEYPVVRPWQISGSAQWYNHADAIVSVWRALQDEKRTATGEVEFHMSKIRFQPDCGQLGMVRLFFDRVTTRYETQSRTPYVAATTSRRQQPRLAPWETAAEQESSHA